jgi:hypothetical protein
MWKLTVITSRVMVDRFKKHKMRNCPLLPSQCHSSYYKSTALVIDCTSFQISSFTRSDVSLSKHSDTAYCSRFTSFYFLLSSSLRLMACIRESICLACCWVERFRPDGPVLPRKDETVPDCLSLAGRTVNSLPNSDWPCSAVIAAAACSGRAISQNPYPRFASRFIRTTSPYLLNIFSI